jgi:hypothetical protein
MRLIGAEYSSGPAIIVSEYLYEASMPMSQRSIYIRKGCLSVELNVVEWIQVIPQIERILKEMRQLETNRIDNEIPEGEAAALAAGLM